MVFQLPVHWVQYHLCNYIIDRVLFVVYYHVPKDNAHSIILFFPKQFLPTSKILSLNFTETSVCNGVFSFSFIVSRLFIVSEEKKHHHHHHYSRLFYSIKIHTVFHDIRYILGFNKHETSAFFNR